MPNRPTETETAARAPAFGFDRIVGRSRALKEAVALARTIAQARLASVLLVGETGTGKELFARGIHYEGPNPAGPFVAVNCAAIPESLLESELFGHEAGAFTGATGKKLGLMELAVGGTLFLDEIHHLPRLLQPKLLRVLEERSLRRVGGTHEIAVACRVIASSNVSIEDAVAKGEFRDDLFYRLNVLRVDIPPLRHRGGDVELLAEYFIGELAREHQCPPKALTPAAAELLRGHTWPGNVRELKNVIERAVVLGAAESELQAGHLVLQRRTATPASTAAVGEIAIPAHGKTLEQIEREAVQLTLRLTNGNQSHAARLLGISRPTLARIVRETPLGGMTPIRPVARVS